MVWVYVGAIGIAIFVLGLTFWVTNKAYSKKWDEEDE